MATKKKATKKKTAKKKAANKKAAPKKVAKAAAKPRTKTSAQKLIDVARDNKATREADKAEASKLVAARASADDKRIAVPDKPSGLKVLKFQARGRSKEPIAIGLKLRSSHPTKGVKEANTSLALREAGASYALDLSQFTQRIDLDCMTRITWFMWKAEVGGTFWLGDLKLE